MAMEAGSREILPNQEWGLKASRRAPREAKKESRNPKERESSRSRAATDRASESLQKGSLSF